MHYRHFSKSLFAQNLEKFRINRELSKTELCKYADISSLSTYRRYIDADDVAFPPVPTLVKLAQALKTSVESFFHEYSDATFVAISDDHELTNLINIVVTRAENELSFREWLTDFSLITPRFLDVIRMYQQGIVEHMQMIGDHNKNRVKPGRASEFTRLPAAKHDQFNSTKVRKYE